MAQCTTDKCNLDGKYEDKCALHCIKSDYQSDKLKGILDDFYSELIQYIYVDFTKHKPQANITLEKFTLSLEGKSDLLVKVSMSGLDTILRGIYFPEFSVQDSNDFISILNRLSRIHFESCDFATSLFDLEGVEINFTSCIFHKEFTVSNKVVLSSDYFEALYTFCEFKSKVSLMANRVNEVKTIYLDPIFCHCTFKSSLNIADVELQSKLFIEQASFESMDEIEELYINESVFKDKFILNNYTIDKLEVVDSKFKNKVELKNNKVNNAQIKNTNFEALFDAHESEFITFKIKKSIFDDFVGFEKCIFGCKNDLNIRKAEFEYVTFLNFTNFRTSTFHNGLDLEHTNLKESPNFLNAKICEKDTNRETFRIIKDSFDKIGNQIEANKYFAYEMRKYKEELKASKTFSTERVIFWFNEKVSNFGSSIGRPFFLMVSCITMYYLLVLGYESNLLYRLYEPANKNISLFMTQANIYSKGIPPYGRFLKDGMEFVTLIFHVFFLIFTWHFIVAIKRCTKR